MKKRSARRYSKVQKAIVYIRDIGRGFVTVYDPESLRAACFTVSNYLERLELTTTENAKRTAVHDVEATLTNGSPLQFTFLNERKSPHEYIETT